MRLKIFTSLDYLLLLCILFLTGIGIAFIYSSGFNSDGINVSNEYIKQIIWLGVGLVLLVLVALFDYRRLNKYSFHFFAFMLHIHKIFWTSCQWCTQLDWNRRLRNSAI